jgi:hypothetical protein
VRNRTYELTATIIDALIAVIVVAQVFTSNSSFIKLWFGVLSAVALFVLVRAPRSARAYIAGSDVIVRGLLRTYRIPVGEIDQFVVENGYVNLYRRLYVKLIKRDGTTKRFTQFVQPASALVKLQFQTGQLNRSVKAAQDHGS